MPFMSEAIELPPEANPLNHQTLYNSLTRASSTDQQQVKTATQQLQNWEKTPGFYSSLQTVFIDTSLPLEVRYLAAIQIKNGIEKYWRKTASNAITKEEKTLIRSRCLESGINEPDHRLALQNALVVAKIVRYEFPQDWPDVIHSIVNHLRQASQSSTNGIYFPRVLLILLYVIKELATGRLQRTRASLQNAAPEIFQVLAKAYVEKVQSWMNFLRNSGDDEGGALNDVEQSLLVLRVLRRLLIAGYEHPNREHEIHEIWNVTKDHFANMLSLVNGAPQSLQTNVQSLVEKHLIQMSKLHLEMARVHPAAYALLPDASGLARAYWGLLVSFGDTFGSQTAITSKVDTGGDAEDEEMPYMEKLSLRSLLLLRACVKMVFSPAQTFKYQRPEDKEERKKSVDLIKGNLLNASFARDMMETLVTRFFVFRPKDLREWEEEPEEWERREEGEGDVWEFSIRSCAEKLFLDLVINYKEQLIPPLLQVFHAVATPQNTDVLLKDSIYSAIGLAAPVLEQRLDFGKFLNDTLVPEVQVQTPGYNILRRRMAIVLGQWLPVKDGLNRPMIYQIFQYLLDKNDDLNDQVVRVTAGRQLKNIVDPFEFTSEPFMPFAPTILERLMALIEEVELTETKLALLNTMNVLVVKMEHHITPFADQIMSLLPPLWTQSGEEYIMKQSILSILAALITSTKSSSQRYHQLVLPLIQSSLDPESPSRLYLLEDALDLWTSILAETPTSSPELLSLIPLLLPLLENLTPILRVAIHILESYLLLAPSHILSLSQGLSPLLSSLLANNPKPEPAGLVCHLLELLIQSATLVGGPPAIDILVRSLSTPLLSTLTSNLHSAYLAHQTTGPNRTLSSIDGIVETDHLAVLARIALASPEAFVQAMQIVAATITPQAAQHYSSPSFFEDLISWLLTEWFAHLDNIGNPERKKLMCLALTRLLRFAQPWILLHLQELMTMWTDVVVEVIELSPPEDEDNGGGLSKGLGRDCLVWRAEVMASMGQQQGESVEEGRKREMACRDEVHRVDVREVIRSELVAVVAACGGEEAFQREWVGNVDEDVVKAFGGLGIL